MRTLKFSLLSLLLCVTLIVPASAAPDPPLEQTPQSLSEFPTKVPEGAAGPQMATDAENVELVGHIGGSIRGVAVQGKYAYIGVGPRLVVLDISNPTNPTRVGQSGILPGRMEKVFLSGDYAYVAAWDAGLRVVDVSDPTNPHEVGYCDTPGWARSVFVSGSHAYVADHDGGLRVADISDSANPHEVGHCYTPGRALDVFVSGSYVYVADGDEGVRIIDASDAASPYEVGHYDLPDWWGAEAEGVFVSGSYAYVAALYEGLRVVDVSDPTNPVEVGYCDTPDYAVFVFVSGSYAYVAEPDIRVIDISDPANPRQVGYCDVPGWRGAVFVSGAHAYVATGYEGLRIIDVSEPAAPLAAGCYETPLGWGADLSVFVSGSYAYVGGAPDGKALRVVDVSDPATPRQVGYCQTGGYGYGVYVSGDYAYVADAHLGVVDVSDPANPYEVGHCDLAEWDGVCEWARRVFVSGSYAYLAGMTGGLGVVDVSDPANPHDVGYYDTPGWTYDVFVSTQYAYLANQHYDSAAFVNLPVVDISEPTNPREVGYYRDTPGQGQGIFVSGDYAYLTDEYAGLRVIDVSDPVNPHEVGSCYMPEGAWDVFVCGDYAYVAGGYSGGLRVVDVSAPANPLEVGYYDTAGCAEDVFVSGSYVYLVTSGAGLFILRFTGGEPTPAPMFLDLPVSYSNFSEAAQGNVGGSGPGRANSWFDHTYPNYGVNDNLTRWDGRIFDFSVFPPQQGVSWYDGHGGVDFQHQRSVQNEPVFAAAPGIVAEVCRSYPCRRGWSCGNYVLINHENGYATLYAHLKEVDGGIVEGTEITDLRSQPLGIMGSTGRSTGTHLHFGVYYDRDGDGQWTESEVVDPYGWSGSGSDPWSVASHYLWKHPLWIHDTADSSGTSICSPSGGANVIIPPGALTSAVTLELWDAPPVAAPSMQLRSTGRSFWLRVLEWLTGNGLEGGSLTNSRTFAQPVTMSVTYGMTEVLHLDSGQLTICRWDESTNTWTSLPTTVDTSQNQATAETTDIGSFDLQAPLLCTADSQEPNDDYDAAKAILADGTPVSYLFDVAEDEDWLRLAAVAAGKYTIQTGSLSPSVDTLVEVYDQDGLTLLTWDDNSAGGAASLLEWQAPLDGTYFVRVAQASGSAYGCDAAYEITITQTLQLYLPLILRN